MNFTSIRLQQTLRQLEATMPEATLQQRELLDKLHRDIEENGRFYEITSLTVPLSSGSLQRLLHKISFSTTGKTIA